MSKDKQNRSEYSFHIKALAMIDWGLIAKDLNYKTPMATVLVGEDIYVVVHCSLTTKESVIVEDRGGVKHYPLRNYLSGKHNGVATIPISVRDVVVLKVDNKNSLSVIREVIEDLKKRPWPSSCVRKEVKVFVSSFE